MSGSTSNFLWQGQPLAPQPTGSNTANTLPAWLSEYTYRLGNAASNLAAQPYTPFPGQQVATPSQATQNAWGMAESNVGNYAPTFNNALSNTAAAGSPIQTPTPITAPQISAQRIANPQTITANPVTANAITSEDIDRYMNPYQDKVIGALRQAANENLFTDILPNVQDRFVSAGQSRSPQEMQMTNNAIYKSQQALDQAIAGALDKGYTGALNTAAQQQGFLTNLATQQQGFNTGLAQQQQGVQLGLDTQQQQFMTALAQQERDRQMALDQYNQTTGLNVAQGNRAAAQGSGAQYGQLAALQQQLGASDVGQLAAAGQAQDQTNQANINAALNSFYAASQWPYQNLGFASNIVRGLPVNTNQQVVGQTYNVPYSASPLSTFLGTTLGASALGLKDGGHVKQPRRDGALAVWTKV